jgi:dihydroorotate dehydrogenase
MNVYRGVIMFPTQPSMTEQYARDVFAAAKKEDMFVIVKLHPRETSTKKYKQAAKKENAEIVITR